jgi:AraC-like DNA-binding protein
MNDEKYEKTHQSSGPESLSDLFRLLNLTVDVYHNAKICGDWRVQEHALGATCFHMVTMGSCVLDVPGHLNTELRCGDLVIFPRELPHQMTSTKTGQGEQAHFGYREAVNIDGTGMLCGSVQFRHKINDFLLDALPPVFVISNRNKHQWMASLSELILLESMESGPASKAILDKLSELLFIYALRQYIEDHPVKSGMLALYSHQRLAKAVYAIHKAPEKTWTLEMMAREASLSRTVFAETFKAVSGWTAGHYLTWWRMQLAWAQLKHGDRIIDIADAVGYKSEAAFSRAFQRMFSISPSKVKRMK